VTILHEDATLSDLSSATLVFVYLVPAGLKAIEPKLRGILERGGRLASYMFSVPGWEPVGEEVVKGGCKVRFYDSKSLS
jgi:hypothetical protein